MHSSTDLFATGVAAPACRHDAAPRHTVSGMASRKGEFGEPVVLDVDGFDVRVSSPERVYFAARGETKLDLVKLLPLGRRRHRQRAARAAVHAAPLPRRRLRRQGAPEAAAPRCAAVGRDGAAALPPLRPARRRAVRHPARRRRLGRADVHRRVPPVEQPPGRHREARRVAHRPRPDAGRPLLAACGGPRTSPTRCSTSSAPSAGRRPAGGTGCTSTCGSGPTTGSVTCAERRWPSRGRSSAASPTTSRRPGGARTATPRRCSSTTTRTRATTRSRRPTRCAATTSAPSRRPSGGTSSTTSSRTTSPSRRSRSGIAELGDLHAGIDDAVFDIAPLLEWAERDEAAGAEPPPEPEDDTGKP